MAQQINLYDASLGIQRDWLSAESFAFTVMGALLLVAALAGSARWQVRQLEGPASESATALQTEQAAIQELARRIEALRPDAKLAADVASTQATLEQRQSALQMLRAGGLGYQDGHAAALQAFAHQSVDGLWLTGIVLDKRDMALRGRAMTPDLIPAYVGKLNQEPALQGRSFRALDIARPLQDMPASATPAAATRPAVATAPPLAAFVEFSLTGSGGSVVAAKDDKR